MKRLVFFAMVLIFCVSAFTLYAQNQKEPQKKTAPSGVCPPFYLKDEAGNIIDPVNNVNADKPYSPKQTCGAKGCHDYNKITEGFHFTQGKGEKPTPDMEKRYLWVSTPGDYGGTWCSPAPLYRGLAPKKNTDPRKIDMTSFDYIAATCGYCHPGGGPLEYDREGNRYDEHMKKQGMKSGEENNLDGDYFKARWSDTGIIEADCLLCHMPEYNFKDRNKQIDNLTFKWAATAGSGLGKVEGSIKESKPVRVTYDISKFDDKGMISPHMVKEPRNTTCLHCHSKPGWKKRGASFSPRTDVHIRAGLRCVDCHPAGNRAQDKRIQGKEVHQIGKGDDPSGHVRDDLDNTMLDCKYCHTNGYLGASIAKHDGLPPHHLEKIACQTCHIPWRYAKAAQVQVSDVFNPAPKISPPPKRIWTFYDTDMNYWNHYGELNMFTKEDQTTNPFRPVLIRYKGKIYPANRVHSAWPGLMEDGKSGLNQPLMKDIFMMWQMHNENPSKYSELSRIVDDSGDGVPEVNKPEEIDAVINSVRQYLTDTKYDLTGKKVVWILNDKLYSSGNKWEKLPKHDYEASPYASVYKYSHDVAPAKAALGSKGCSDCHSKNSHFFFAQVLEYPFGDDGKPITVKQADLLGYKEVPSGRNPWTYWTGVFFKYLTIVVLFGLVVHMILDALRYYRKRS